MGVNGCRAGAIGDRFGLVADAVYMMIMNLLLVGVVRLLVVSGVDECNRRHRV